MKKVIKKLTFISMAILLVNCTVSKNQNDTIPDNCFTFIDVPIFGSESFILQQLSDKGFSAEKQGNSVSHFYNGIFADIPCQLYFDKSPDSYINTIELKYSPYRGQEGTDLVNHLQEYLIKQYGEYTDFSEHTDIQSYEYRWNFDNGKIVLFRSDAPIYPIVKVFFTNYNYK